MWRISSPFSVWVVPLRALAVVVFLYAFVRMLAAPDLTLIIIALMAALLWQAGSAAEARSPLFRRLRSTRVQEIMRTQPVRVRSWVSVAGFRKEHTEPGVDMFILTTQDGYDAGVLLPDELSRVSEDAARYTQVGQVARPLSFVHALRVHDPLTEAFLRFRRNQVPVLPVLDRWERLAGVVTARDLDAWLSKAVSDTVRTRASGGSVGEWKRAA